VEAVDDMEGAGGSSCGKPGSWVWAVISGIGSSSSFDKS